MTKRVLALLLCVLMVLPLLAACNSAQQPEHTHTYADVWSSSEEGHWKGTTCGHEQKSEQGAHVFGDAELIEGELCSSCSVCGFVKKELHVHEYGEWATVKFNDTNAYVSQKYIIIEEGAPSQMKVYVTASLLNIRSGAGTGYSIAGQATYGAELDLPMTIGNGDDICHLIYHK